MDEKAELASVLFRGVRARAESNLPTTAQTPGGLGMVFSCDLEGPGGKVCRVLIFIANRPLTLAIGA
jgi:hypothetical protein